MTLAKALLKARTLGVRNFRNKLSQLMHTHEMFIVTEHGKPTSVLLPYNDILEIVDILDELRDRGAIDAVAKGRRAIRAGRKGVSVSKTFSN